MEFKVNYSLVQVAYDNCQHQQDGSWRLEYYY
jgi:hypothetical protein